MDYRRPTRQKSSLLSLPRVKAEELLRVLAAQGLTVITLDCYRDPWTQARLYRQSRLRTAIDAHIATLEKRGYPELAAILEGVGPQRGTLYEHVTYAGPGESWHQYGMAVDLVPRYDSKRLLWDIPIGRGTPESEAAAAMWDLVGAAASHVGLEWAGTWPSPDRMHVQMPASKSPLEDRQLVAETAARCGWYSVDISQMPGDES